MKNALKYVCVSWCSLKGLKSSLFAAEKQLTVNSLAWTIAAVGPRFCWPSSFVNGLVLLLLVQFERDALGYQLALAIEFLFAVNAVSSLHEIRNRPFLWPFYVSVDCIVMKKHGLFFICCLFWDDLFVGFSSSCWLSRRWMRELTSLQQQQIYKSASLSSSSQKLSHRIADDDKQGQPAKAC